ncbi:hypothetical protein D3C87_2145290 [compost metagenome]
MAGSYHLLSGGKSGEYPLDPDLDQQAAGAVLPLFGRHVGGGVPVVPQGHV